MKPISGRSAEVTRAVNLLYRWAIAEADLRGDKRLQTRLLCAYIIALPPAAQRRMAAKVAQLRRAERAAAT